MYHNISRGFLLPPRHTPFYSKIHSIAACHIVVPFSRKGANTKKKHLLFLRKDDNISYDGYNLRFSFFVFRNNHLLNPLAGKQMVIFILIWRWVSM